MNLKIVVAVGAAIFACVIAVGTPVQAAPSCSLMNGIDLNHDNKLSVREIRSAAKRTFARLNDDGDRTLERDELRGRMGPKAFASADRIKGRGIDRIEYMRYVRKLFYKINRDRDRTLECPELCTRRGMRLVRLLR